VRQRTVVDGDECIVISPTEVTSRFVSQLHYVTSCLSV